MSRKKRPNFIYTNRLLITAITMDATLEFVLLGKYYDIETGCYRPAQLICGPGVFRDLAGLLSFRYPDLVNRIKDTIQQLTEEPLTMKLDDYPGSGVTFDGGIFGLEMVEFFDEQADKFVETLSHPLNEDQGTFDLADEQLFISSKVNPSRTTFYLFDFVFCKLSFDPRRQWARDIGENPKFMPFANQVAYLQIKFRFYLRLRDTGTAIGAAKQIACLRPASLFTLARTIYSISANPNDFHPD